GQDWNPDLRLAVLDPAIARAVQVAAGGAGDEPGGAGGADEGVAAHAAVEGAGPVGAVGDVERVYHGAAGQVLEAGEEDAIDVARVFGGDVPGVVLFGAGEGVHGQTAHEGGDVLEAAHAGREVGGEVDAHGRLVAGPVERVEAVAAVDDAG